MNQKVPAKRRRALLPLLALPLGGLVCMTALAAEQEKRASGPGLLLHARMDSKEEINGPSVVRRKVAGWEKGAAVRTYQDGKVLFEKGDAGGAARFVANGRSLASAVSVFSGTNFSFSDEADEGGKVEFWLKFNEDPHQFKGNKFILRTEPYPPVFTMEIYGTKPFLAVEFFGNGNNPNTNYRFLTYTEGWDKWYGWKQAEWHKLTVSWKRNKGKDTAEMHLYIDDSQEGCPERKCNDYGGVLPELGRWQEVVLGNFGRKFAIDFSVRDLKSWGTDQ